MNNHEYLKLKFLSYLLHHEDFYGSDYPQMPLWETDGVRIRNHRLIKDVVPSILDDVVVVTNYSKQLSWLFYLLSLVCVKKIAIIGAKEFYIMLAHQANECIDNNESTKGFSAKVFLDYMLSCVESLYEDEIQDEGVDYEKIFKVLIVKHNRINFMNQKIAIDNRLELLKIIDELEID